MSLIIDGYNLMYAAGILPAGSGARPGAGSFERSRLALLNFIAETVAESELSTTTVVFDAAAAPPGLPRTLTHRGVTVQFSSGYNDADELIEELILKSTSPRRLTVVSSDHRLHRAARRRKAQAIDSDVWHAQVIAHRNQPRDDRPTAPQKPGTPVAMSEVEFWLKKFTEPAEPTKNPVRKRTLPKSTLPKSTPAKSTPAKSSPAKPTSPPEPAHGETPARPEESSKEELVDDDIFPQEYLDSIDEE
jgi:predicted RNA-binding protein with PIN domain